jgi:phospholipase/carboxylesterase
LLLNGNLRMSLIVHLPPLGTAQQLLMLFHGVGAGPDDLVPLGKLLGGQFPHSAIISIQAPFDCAYSSGFEWFSVLHDGQRIDDEVRRARVAQALPDFIATVQHWQAHFKVAPQATALIGFSQGAIMALAASQLPQCLASRVVSLSGRYATLPEAAPELVTIHLIHGKHDEIIPYAHTIEAAERLVQLGADVTADVLPFVGHEINEEVAQLLIERLSTHVPQRYWQAAQAAQAADSPPD